MQKTKKILSVIVAMLMLLSMMVPMASAAEFSDVATTHKYYKAISNLSAYGILEGFEDGTFRPEDTVTRAQFAKIICYALNVGTVTSGAIDTGFTDVDPNHWAAGNIKMAASRGIINGMGDGTFRPEDPVKFEQAVKMVVCALGYGARAENEGGFPDGHMSVAATLGLLKGIAADDNVREKSANRGTIAELVDNMLETEQLTSTGIKGGTIKDQTVKTESVNGQIVSVYGSTIYAGETSDCSRYQIELLTTKGDLEFYSVSELDSVKANINEYLGRRVTVYYDPEDDLNVPILTNLTLQANRNEEVVVDLTSIQDYSNTEVEYIEDEDSGDEATVSVYADANILYNGVATTDSLSSLIDTSAPGQITFLDSDADGDADVVFIKVYTTMVVKSKASSTYKLYDEASSANAVTLDEEDKSKSITIKKNGKTSEFKNINVGDVVSYASSAGDKVIDVLVSNTVVSGSVSQINSTKGTITIRTSSGDKTYKFSTYFNDNSTVTLTVGTNGKFYLDAFGKIAKADVSSESAYTYAYLTGFENVGGSTTPSYAVQLIKINGSTSANKVQYSLADKFKIDGESYTDETSDIETALVEAAKTFNPGFDATEATKYCQVIKFTTNSSGKIDKIITADYNLDEDNDLDVDNTYLETGAKCTSSGSRLESKYAIGSAKVLFVPETREASGSDKFIGYSASYFKVDGKLHNVQFVDMTEGLSVPIIIVYGTAEDQKDVTWATCAPMVVTDKGIAIPEGGTESATYVEVLTSAGAEAKYFEGEDAVGILDDVEIGDVIRIDVDGEDMIQEIKVVTTLEKMLIAGETGGQAAGATGEGENSAQDYAQYRQIFGTAYSVSDNTILVAKGFGEDVADADQENIGTNGSTKVIVVDSAKVATGSSNAIVVEALGEIVGYSDQPENASKILIYTASGTTAKTIVIFK